MSARIQNIAGVPVTLPGPIYQGVLMAGASAVVPGTPADVIRDLGGLAVIGALAVSAAPSGSPTDARFIAAPFARVFRYGTVSSHLPVPNGFGDLGTFDASEPNVVTLPTNGTYNFPTDGTLGGSVAPARSVNVRFLVWNGGDVTLTGIDQFDKVVSETYLAGVGVTRVGAQPFKRITGITKTLVGGATPCSLQMGTKMGFPLRVVDADALLFFRTGNSGVEIPIDVDLASHAWTSSVPPDGLSTFAAIANVLNSPA